MDKTNLASALTAGFASDIGVDQNTINLGNQLMYLGVVLLEIPSNLLLHKVRFCLPTLGRPPPVLTDTRHCPPRQVGPQRWISGQVAAFGLAALGQVLVAGRAGFLASRAALGLAESGYIPAALFTLSAWYARERLARRLAVFFFGMFGGNAIAPILASGILRLDGARGWRGWQWLFLGEQLPSF